MVCWKKRSSFSTAPFGPGKCYCMNISTMIPVLNDVIWSVSTLSDLKFVLNNHSFRSSLFPHCRCNEPCSSNCVNGTCYQNKTCMEGCELNHWGPDCNQECSVRCAQGLDNSTTVCDRNGICVFGCKKTFMGQDCLQSCPVNCPERDCNATSGHCLQGTLIW